ncbi:hydantoinase/oxoprolinase family protein [Conexibacter sp. CPCC 206217]|uniref:hydantoinase/oxoprolinase family protein n=1 Tax=Conexibacter sp. CPCC 206217 TaxID=3064574 RepID=UPI00271FF44C|nr:hydantoinase/oxoprolinase family protein [Conexibacter sp. CPCC 206217]MDO8212227.1 hydantoinase/oxoprolinase family protein [Conexibacter sp. CPCC 206217]
MSPAASGMMGVDVGGTFTDVIAIVDGRIVTGKVPSRPSAPEDAVLEGAAIVGAREMAAFNHASTVGLNAVITRRLGKVAFLTTEGHRDILDVGNTWRPFEALTDASWRRPFGDAAAPLVPRYLRRGVRERMTVDGTPLIELDAAQAREQLELLRRCDVEGVAICLLHAYVNPDHERRLRALVRDVLGDVPCSISSEVSPLAKEYARASTTVVDVIMKIVYGGYTARLEHGLGELGFGGDLNFADCAAMLLASDFAMESPARIIFAGPAAGTVSSAHFGTLIDEPNLVCADVGGTSCDISIVTDGRPFVNTTFEIEHDLVVNALSTEISTLGAGGGSIVSVSSTGELRVGPASAGAEPGPACYGRGGQAPTMTDAALLIGILDGERFAGGRMRLREDLARDAFAALELPFDFAQRVAYAWNLGLNTIAEGLLDIAISHGVDPRDYTLVAYGAAGPMMLPSVMELVGLRRVVVPPHPGLFSALGLLSADLVYADSRSAYTLLDAAAAEEIDAVFAALEERLLARVGDARGRARVLRSFDGRLLGQSWETPFVEAPAGRIDAAAVERMVQSFHREYEARTGNRFDQIAVQGVTYRVQVVVESDKVDYPRLGRRAQGGAPVPLRTIPLHHLGALGEQQQATEHARDQLLAGDRIEGPALVRESMSTTFVPAGCVATVGELAEIAIERTTRGTR